MSNKFVRELRYEVIKLKDAKAYLTEAEIDTLARIGEKVSAGRARDGKAPLSCVVVESDWPEYEPTWSAIEARCNGVRPSNFHRDMGITLLDAKWLDPECHKGCQSLVLKQRAERATGGTSK